MKLPLWIVILVLLGLTVATVIEAPPLQAAPPERDSRPWKVSTPEEQGLDSRIFLEGLSRLRTEESALHSLLVLRNGYLVLECYVHPYGPDTLHNVKSVSKSIISAVTGIALEKGILTSLDRPVRSYFPEYFTGGTDPRKEAITLRHLLTMTSGLELDENGPLMSAVFASDDWIKATFERPMAAAPGTVHLYSTPLTHALSGILTRASGKTLLDLSREVIFDPLGIEEVQWQRGPQGYYFGGAELFLKPRDMAKFGLLYLSGGRWRGRQVVPEAWVRESTRNQLSLEEADQKYGYYWWLPPDGGYMAMGWGGQVILVDPAEELVIVSTAGESGDLDRLFRGFEDYEPSPEPLPANPAAVKALRNLIEELGSPRPEPAAALPPIARRISGRRFLLDENPRGFQAVSLEFRDNNVATYFLSTPSGDQTFLVGLDGIHRLTETGGFGQMPEGNRFAMRGSWADRETFVIESGEMGNPIHGVSRMTFPDGGERISIEVSVAPIGTQFTLTGKAPAGGGEEGQASKIR